MPLMQTLSATDEEQTYIFLRDAGEKFNVLVITIDATRRDSGPGERLAKESRALAERSRRHRQSHH